MTLQHLIKVLAIVPISVGQEGSISNLKALQIFFINFDNVSLSSYGITTLSSLKISFIIHSKAEFARPIARLGSSSTFLYAFSKVWLAVSKSDFNSFLKTGIYVKIRSFNS